MMELLVTSRGQVRCIYDEVNARTMRFRITLQLHARL